MLLKVCILVIMMNEEIMSDSSDDISDSSDDFKVSFGYQCNLTNYESVDKSKYINIPCASKLKRANSSFSSLSGAAISANTTLANTNICNGLFGSEILPALDSPNSFRRIPSSPSLNFLSSSLQSNMSKLSFSPSSPSEALSDSFFLNSMSDPSRSDSLLNSMEVQIAGGAAGEDRVQAVCSEENNWVFCAIYDGFNGRDAADFLAGTLYEKIVCHLNLLDWDLDHESKTENAKGAIAFKQRVLNSLQESLSEAENEFLNMVEQELVHRKDLVSIGSCVLISLLHEKNLYLLNVGDSRAVLATYNEGLDINRSDGLEAIQLTESHTVDNEVERIRLVNAHLDDPSTVVRGRVKGKLKVTRAFGVGYLKKKHLNDALMGILRVSNLISPPYVSLEPSLCVHDVSNSDHFVVLGSDGLFDFFSNKEVVELVYSYILKNPSGDPAKFLVELLVERAAETAGCSVETLMNIKAGVRRKYHDDVTVIVIVLGTNKRTSKASTFL